MNRALFVLLAGLVLLAGQPATAIENIHAGVKGGYAMAGMSTDPDSDTDFRNGISLGGYVGLPVTPAISIQPEALFTMKGDSADDTTLKLNYIEVPVLAKASFMPTATAKPSLFLGPSVAYNLTAKTAVDTETIDVKDAFNDFDFGVVFGGGLDFPLSSGAKSLGIDVRYSMGLTNTIDTDTGIEAKNNVLSIMGTLGFL